MVDKLTAGVGDALNAVMAALLELPNFAANRYFQALQLALEKLDPDKTIAETMREIGSVLPAYPLVGEARARIEAMLVEDARSDTGIAIKLPAGSLALEGRYGYSKSTTTAGSIAVEIAARYDEPARPFDMEALRDLKVGDLLAKVRELAQATQAQ